jgi:flagellar basal body-associated protein FliL
MALFIITRVLFNSCKKTSELIDEQSFRTLTIKEKMQLQVHKSICKNCEGYEKHSKLIDSIISKWFMGKSKENLKMPEQAKAKIIEEINKS